MSSFHVHGALAALAVLAAPALASAQPADSMNQNPPAAAQAGANQAAPTDPAMAPSATGAAANTSGTTLSASQVTPDQAQALQSGDNTTVTNGPVPDTPANRAKFGSPMSNAGKRTAPAGN